MSSRPTTTSTTHHGRCWNHRTDHSAPTAVHRRSVSIPGKPGRCPWQLNNLKARRQVVVKSNAGDDLSSSFAQHLNAHTDIMKPNEHRTPSHLLSPVTVVAAQMSALQLNDWPDTDAGVMTAFRFTRPRDTSLAGCKHARTWSASEEWLDFNGFSNMLHSPPYKSLLACDTWKAISGIEFPSSRMPNRAIQAIEVEYSKGSGTTEAGIKRTSRFTFCLEKITEGSYKNCWLTVGVRVGDYVNS